MGEEEGTEGGRCRRQENCMTGAQRLREPEACKCG